MRKRSNKRYGPYYDTGGKGAMPTSRGEAYKWWVPCQFTSVQRLLLATRLAMEPATMEDLRNASGLSYSEAYMVIRNWVQGRYADWTMFEPIGGRRTDARFRIVTLTDDGRKDLWRYAQVTRRLRFPDTFDAPFRADMPEDPLEALRLYARPEFLRPAALALLNELIGWPGQNGLQLGEHLGNKWTTYDWITRFRKAGFLSNIGDDYPEAWCITSPHWILNDLGHDALNRHIDALRRAALVSGYTPERSCEHYYPREQDSPCTWSMTADTPPPCPNCPYHWYVVQEQQREEESKREN